MNIIKHVFATDLLTRRSRRYIYTPLVYVSVEEGRKSAIKDKIMIKRDLNTAVEHAKIRWYGKEGRKSAIKDKIMIKRDLNTAVEHAKVRWYGKEG